jgi:AcrR family transcriptional regulator
MEGAMENKVRDQIIASAFEVLNEAGPAKMRVQEVARRAGVSPTLLYYYFDGKHALVAAAYAKDYSTILEQDVMVVNRAFEASSSMAEFTAAMGTLISDHNAPSRRRRRLAVLATAQTDPAVAEAIREPNRAYFVQLHAILSECQDRGWIDTSTDVAALSMMWMSLPLGLVYGDLHPELAVDIRDYVNTLRQFAEAPVSPTREP